MGNELIHLVDNLLAWLGDFLLQIFKRHSGYLVAGLSVRRFNPGEEINVSVSQIMESRRTIVRNKMRVLAFSTLLVVEFLPFTFNYGTVIFNLLGIEY